MSSLLPTSMLPIGAPTP